MSVTAFCGYWGSGKTLQLARHGLAALDKGREVYTNFGLEGAGGFQTLEDFTEILASASRRCPRTVLIDEMGALFPSDEPTRFSPAMKILWTQGRKFGLDVAYTAQDFSFVQRKIRLVTQTVVNCKGHGKKKLPPDADGIEQDPRPYWFSRAYYHAVNGELKGLPYKRRAWVLDKKAAASYDTYALIESAQAILRAESGRDHRPLVVLDTSAQAG